jgi:hypothetical protein
MENGFFNSIYYLDEDNMSYVIDNKKEVLEKNIIFTLTKSTEMFNGRIPKKEDVDEIDSIIDNDNLYVALLPIIKFDGDTYSFSENIDSCLSVSEIKEKLNNNVVIIFTIPNNYHGDVVKFRTIIKPINN